MGRPHISKSPKGNPATAQHAFRGESETVKVHAQEKIFGSFDDDEFIVNGIPVGLVTQVAQVVGLAAEAMASNIGVTRSTYHRKMAKPSTRLSVLESDALARYGRLATKAKDTFDGDANAAQRWLQSSQPGLGGKIPIEMARTTIGFREVEKLLTRIDYGVYA